MQTTAQSFEVSITWVPVSVGQEGEEFGGAERPWSSAFHGLSTAYFGSAQIVGLVAVRARQAQEKGGVFRTGRQLTPGVWEDWFPIHCKERNISYIAQSSLW